MRGKAVSHGAITIVNALATGKGAACGIGLWTEAIVELTDDADVVEGRILSDPDERPTLIQSCVKRVFDRFGLRDVGARVTTNSNIPIAKGLKSSSVAANAIVLATLSAIGKEVNDPEVLNIAVDAALEAKVTVTGAFDDASASYFGNLVVTDNFRRKILRRFQVEDLTVLLHIPEKKLYTVDADISRMRLLASQVEIAHREAVRGNYWAAMTLNGLVYSSSLGYPTEIVLSALKAGAIAAGLSGKGPAVAVVVENGKVDDVRDDLEAYEGDLVTTKTNTEKARVIG